MRDAFGPGGLKAWPTYPGRKGIHVADPSVFGPYVSEEYRCKDESGERGVTLLMARLNNSTRSAVKAVLFDSYRMNDVQAARWWNSNKHRFEIKPW